MMTSSQIGASLARVRVAFERHPAAALQEDSPAVAVWAGGLGTRLAHPGMSSFCTDMPAVLGGAGLGPSPGWFFRAGVASCMVTSIAIQAAIRGIVLTRLEVEARSESDARGLLGIAPGVPAGPLRFWLEITLEAGDTPQAELNDLLEAANAQAPMSDALRRPLDVSFKLRHVVPAGG